MSKQVIPWEKTTRFEHDQIKIVIDRAHRMLKSIDYNLDTISLRMDIEAANVTGKCKLNLDKLITLPDFDFAHDICGFIRNTDRATGKLMNHFVPRCGYIKS